MFAENETCRAAPDRRGRTVPGKVARLLAVLDQALLPQQDMEPPIAEPPAFPGKLAHPLLRKRWESSCLGGCYRALISLVAQPVG